MGSINALCLLTQQYPLFNASTVNWYRQITKSIVRSPELTQKFYELRDGSRHIRVLCNEVPDCLYDLRLPRFCRHDGV